MSNAILCSSEASYTLGYKLYIIDYILQWPTFDVPALCCPLQEMIAEYNNLLVNFGTDLTNAVLE